ncbi:MAG: tyrosine-type recombinase/integrase [Methanomicrobiaceae archaeon]|nr:tyrosine-type recombinase/integrase [Methanomicrobiaceae archaeon]
MNFFAAGFSRIVIAKPYLLAWRQDYLFEPEENNLVFITRQKTPFNNSTIMKILHILRIRTGIEKHVTLHIFRHSRITHIINDGYEWISNKAHDVGKHQHTGFSGICPPDRRGHRP